MDIYDTAYEYYDKTGDYTPLLENAPKSDHWGKSTPPMTDSLLPKGDALLDRLHAAYYGGSPLGASLFYADWASMPRVSQSAEQGGQ